MEATDRAKECTVVHLGNLLDAGDGAVVVLEAGETQLAAHRAVLANRSPVFAAMFAHDTQEARSGVVSIRDVEGAVLRLLLGFCYTLQFPQLPTFDVATQLLAAADKYGVTALKEACERQVAAQLSVQTAAAAAVLAVRHGCSSLREAAVAYIRSHAWEVTTSQDWADAVRMHPGEMDELRRLLSETSAPPPAASGTCPPPSGRRQTPAPAASRHTPPPDDAAVSRLRSLPAQEKNRRLAEAARQGAVGELEALLAAGADVGAEDEQGQTPLHCAADKGHEEAARRLLGAGAAVGARTNGGQQTPLHWAVASGHAAVVRLLLAAGANHGDRDISGWTALHWAAASGHTEAAAALVEAGADRAARTDSGQRTPLHWAADRGHAAVVRLLLAAGANHGDRDSSGWTALHLAARNGHTEAAAALVEAGADRAARSDRGETPLDLARLWNDQHMMELLQPPPH